MGRFKSQKENPGIVHFKFSKTVSTNLDYCMQQNHVPYLKGGNKLHDISRPTELMPTKHAPTENIGSKALH